MKHSSISWIAGALALAVSAGTAAADLGARGTVAIEGDLSLDALRRTTETPSGDERRETRFAVAGNGHYFVAEHVSVGLGAGFGRVSDDDGVETALAASAGAGYHVALGPRLHLWPRAVVGLRQASGPVLGREASLRQVTIAVWAPVLIELAPHFYLGAGPVVSKDVSATVTIDGDERDANRDLNLGLSAVLGGYLGA